MDALVADLIKETTLSSGSELTIALTKEANYGRFADVASVGQSVYYAISSSGDTELGIGTVQAGNTLNRVTPLVTVVSGVYDKISPVRISVTSGSTVSIVPSATALMDIISDIADLSTVYEPIDATILKDADIGVNIQAFSSILDATTAVFTVALEAKINAAELKLSTIESNAKDDQTGAEIKALYESEVNTNAFTDTLLAKINAITGTNTGDETKARVDALGVDAGTLGGLARTGFLEDTDVGVSVQAYAPTVTTVEAEAGTETGIRAWTPERVKESVEANSLGLGDGQTWVDKIASRSAGVIYTNSTGRTIAFSIFNNDGGSANSVVTYVDGSALHRNYSAAYVYAGAIVPAGSTYQITVSGTSVGAWYELTT